MKRSLVLGIALAAFVPGCRRDDGQAARARAEKLLLDRQITGLKALIAAADGKTLVRSSQLLIGADEATVQGLIAASLPQERVVGERYRLRLERAEVQFRASQGLVILKGRASTAAAPDTFVDVTLQGGLDEVAVRQGSFTLVGRIAVDHLQVERAAAAGAEGPALRALAEMLGRERLDALSELMPPVEIPIRLEESISFENFEEGPVSALSGKLPVRASVARVLALAGRLWIVLDVGAGPWRSSPRAKP